MAIRLFGTTLIVLATFCCKGACQLSLITQPQNFTAQPGESVVLPCRVNGTLLRNMTIQWFFIEHGVHLSNGRDILVNDQGKYSFTIPEDSPQTQENLLMKGLTTADNGHYRCGISGTSLSVIHTLSVTGAAEVPHLIPTVTNFSACCENQSVSLSCLPACIPSAVNSSFNPWTACPLSDLDKLLFCFSDSRNHLGCCARRLVPSFCQAFCTDKPPPGLDASHLDCMRYSGDIVSCFEEGQDLLPTPPTDFTSVVMPGSRVVVSWNPPSNNAHQVTGYRVAYKASDRPIYNTTSLLPASYRQYTLDRLQPSTEYVIYIIAVGAHGASLPSSRIVILTIDNEAVTEQNVSIMACCINRNVREPCRSILCSTSTLKHFNPETLLPCYDTLEHVYPCLASEQNHTACCRENDIPDVCLGLCAGKPPPLTWNLTQCSVRLPTIEACVQLGLRTLPSSPKLLSVGRVTDSTAELQWYPPSPSAVAISGYQVQWRQVGTETFQQVLATSNFAKLTDLTADTEYEAQVSSYNENASSIPSSAVLFFTYPNATLNLPAGDSSQIVIAHNETMCCIQNNVQADCLGGCNYSTEIVAFFAQRILLCYPQFQAILSCGSDGRNHSTCCTRNNVPDDCMDLCSITPHSGFQMQTKHLQCVRYASVIKSCFQEGIVDNPKYPSNVQVTNITKSTISVRWTPPSTGPRPSGYIISYQLAANTSSEQTQVNTSGSSYILQNLIPATQYKIEVVSVTNTSHSLPSITIWAFTQPKDIPLLPVIQGMLRNASEEWVNRTHCCSASRLSVECMGLCLNSEPPGTGQLCVQDLQKVLACAADGRDHNVCCRERLVPVSCLGLCQGRPLADNFMGAACLSYYPEILTCFMEAERVIPGPPEMFYVDPGNLEVSVYFGRSTSNCSTSACTYELQYWLTSDVINTKMVYQNITNGTVVSGLTAGQRYIFSVLACNRYGCSIPSSLQEVYISHQDISSVGIIQYPIGIVSVGATVTLTCDVITESRVMVSWLFLGSYLSDDQQLVLHNVSQNNEGNYTCMAKNSFGLEKSASLFLNLKYKPYIVQFRQDQQVPGLGKQVLLSCRFRGHPDPQSITWTKDNKPYQFEISKSFDIRESRLHNGIMAATLKIIKVEESDFGIYRCNASNEFGFALGALNLSDPRFPTDLPLPSNTPPNLTACCISEGVPQRCLGICSLDIDLQTLMQDTKLFVCAQYLPQFAKCGADGRDHSRCCIQKGILPYCTPFCVGKVPSANYAQDTRLLDCISHLDEILGCAESGHNNIPSAPQNVTAVLEESCLVVRWQFPQNNPHRVKYYRVHYMTPHSAEPITHSMPNTFLEYNITDVTASNLTIWVTAGNKFGESHASNMVIISGYGLKPLPPQNLTAHPVSDTAVRLEWMPPTSGLVIGYTVYYSSVLKGPYLTLSSSETRITLENLDPLKTYEAYVTSHNEHGSSDPSKVVHFLTAGSMAATSSAGSMAASSSADEQMKIGLGVGLTVLCIFLLAGAVVVTFSFIRFRRQKKGTSEPVSFDNPSFGSPPSLVAGLPPSDLQPENQFGYGRLQEDLDHQKQVTTKLAASDTNRNGAVSDQSSAVGSTTHSSDYHFSQPNGESGV